MTYQILYAFIIIEKTSNAVQKGKELSTVLGENAAPGNSSDTTLCQNYWAFTGASIQSFLDNWDIFQVLRDEILKWRVDLEVRGQVIGVQMENLISFLEQNWEF